MRPIIILLFGCIIVACGDKAVEVAASDTLTTASETRETSKTMPDFDRYPGACPADVGIVTGAAQSHVNNFVQTYFGVPDGSPGPMRSDIQTFDLDGNVSVITAAIYAMNDVTVDREMASVFVGGKMTQCGVRERCAANPADWVGDCD